MELERGARVLVGGDRWATVPDAIVDRFRSGDRLIVLQASGDLLHVPAAEWEIAADAVRRANAAFLVLGQVTDESIDRFYEAFAARLADDAVWGAIAAANEADVASARSRGRSTTRLVADETMRRGMIEGLREWQRTPSLRGRVIETTEHPGWKVEQLLAGYGVVGFVFEGRPNVFADATGVLRSGNSTVMRIGSDALGTARAIVRHALSPSLTDVGLPAGGVVLVDSPSRAAGWALFSQPSLGLAVARGSGPAVAQLGAVAKQSGIPVSLHGTGGAWMVADATADAAPFRAAVYHSLDRKVCNTLNVVCLLADSAPALLPVFLEAVEARGARLGHGYRLHVVAGSESHVPERLFRTTTRVLRAEGEREEPIADVIPAERLGEEWEWEGTPEVTLLVLPDLSAAVAAFNAHSPRFIASLISEDAVARERFYAAVDAPFVGNGMTRWVDGQYALNRPELGLSNWQFGRLFARGAILTGDGVYTIRLRMTQDDPELHR